MLLGIAPAAGAVASGDTVWYNYLWKECTRNEASFFRTGTVFRNGLYHVTDYYLDGTKQMTGTLTSMHPENRSGDFLYYHEDGSLQSTEHYTANMLNGTATRYFRNSKQVSQRTVYRLGKRDGPNTYYDSASGKVIAIINWKDDKGTGTSKWFNKNDKVVRQVVFKPGRPLGEKTLYDVNGLVTEYGHTDRMFNDQGAWRINFAHSETLRFKLNLKNDIFHGPIVAYDYTCGNVLFSGNYKNGRKDSLWFYYRGCDTNLARIIPYKNGVCDGQYLVFAPGSKLIMREGTDSAGYEQGLWKYYFPGTKQLSMTRNYKAGVLDGTLITYFRDGKIRRREIYEDGTMIKWDCYSTTGSDTIYYRRHSPPEYPEDYQNYFSGQIEYPENALSKELEGVVQVRIFIDEAGKIYDSRVVTSSNNIFNREAERVALTLPIFSPGMDDELPIETTLVLPVVFRVENARVPGGDF